MMQTSRLIALAGRSLKNQPLLKLAYCAADGPLKDREDAAEKIYIK